MLSISSVTFTKGTRISGPKVLKKNLCLTQLSIKFFLLINIKMPTIVGISTFMSRKIALKAYLSPKTIWISWYFYTYQHLKFHAQLSWASKCFNNLGTWLHICFPVWQALLNGIKERICSYEKVCRGQILSIKIWPHWKGRQKWKWRSCFPWKCIHTPKTLKVPIMTEAEDIHKYFFIVFQRKKAWFSCESSA